jgi:hypothetical protein
MIQPPPYGPPPSGPYGQPDHRYPPPPPTRPHQPVPELPRWVSNPGRTAGRVRVARGPRADICGRRRGKVIRTRPPSWPAPARTWYGPHLPAASLPRCSRCCPESTVPTQLRPSLTRRWRAPKCSAGPVRCGWRNSRTCALNMPTPCAAWPKRSITRVCYGPGWTPRPGINRSHSPASTQYCSQTSAPLRGCAADDTDPERARHAAIATLSKTMPLDAVYEAVTDPGRAADLALQRLEGGDATTAGLLAAASPELQKVPFTGGS